jgi:hypothetical protein
MELYQDQARRPDRGDQHSASGTRKLPIPAAARSEAWICGHSLAGFAGSNIDADRTDMDWHPLGRGLEKFMGNPSSGIH